MQDSDLDNLKFSIFMSLAEVKDALCDLSTALGFYWQALQILEKRMDNIQKGQSDPRHTEERPEE